jgi:hypothetical protein
MPQDHVEPCRRCGQPAEQPAIAISHHGWVCSMLLPDAQAYFDVMVPVPKVVQEWLEEKATQCAVRMWP